MLGMMMPMQQDEKQAWFMELVGIMERSENYLDEIERLEEFDLVSVCREFTDKLDEVTIHEGKHDFWDAVLQINEDAKDAVISYYMNAEEDSAKKVCENLISTKEILDKEAQGQ